MVPVLSRGSRLSRDDIKHGDKSIINMNHFYQGTKFKLKRTPYYFHSLKTLLEEVAYGNKTKLLFNLFFPTTKEIKLSKKGLTFKLKTLLDVLTLKEVVIDGCYKPLFSNLKGKEYLLIDIGAGFGDFAIATAKANPSWQIVALECDKRYFKLLNENIKLNKIKNIKAIKKAVFSFADLANLKLDSKKILLKMDTEGYEFSIINSQDKIPINIEKIILEYHENTDHRVENLREILQSNGYKVRIRPHSYPKSLGILTAKK